jgi:thiol-disulfide isomerase/thioredoxin
MMLASPLRVVARRLPLLILVLAGCQQSTPPPPDTSTAVQTTPSAAQLEVAGEPEVTIQVGSWADVQLMVADNLGKIVIVDVWSTWCEPCVREFPNLVRLHREYADDVVCISVNVDYIGVASEPPESFRDKVLEFVRKNKATFPNVISSDPDEEVLQALDAFSVPVVQVYDREGNLRETFTNDDDQYGEEGFTYQQHIIPLVESLR